MEMTGQGAVQERVGLPRLNINYDTETDDGKPLVRGNVEDVSTVGRLSTLTKCQSDHCCGLSNIACGTQR